MKILVIDDEHSFGALLGHTLKTLGHKPVVAAQPEDALAMLDGDVDAVITDIDMPVMNGVELARAIRDRMPEMPVAFCTGSAPECKTLHEARRIGQVLPKVWTVADVKQVVTDLENARRPAPAPRRRRRSHASSYITESIDLPRSTASTRPRADSFTRSQSSVAELYEHAEREASTGRQAAAPAVKPRRVRIAFRAWRQVRKVVNDAERGPVYITVPGPEDLEPGAQRQLSLALPGEITVRIAGEVQAVRPREGAKPDVVIDLKGLDRDTAGRLRALADASEPVVTKRSTGYLRVSPRLAQRTRSAQGSEPPLARGSQDLRVSELLRDNRRMREQIEDLPAKMTPRPETETDS